MHFYLCDMLFCLVTKFLHVSIYLCIMQKKNNTVDGKQMNSGCPLHMANSNLAVHKVLCAYISRIYI